MLTKEQILAAEDRAFEEVQIPEWGGSVRVRALGCDDKDALDASLVSIGKDGKAQQDLTHWRRKVLELSLVDDQNRRLFAAADAEALGQKSPTVADRIITVAMRLSFPAGVSVEETEKN